MRDLSWVPVDRVSAGTGGRKVGDRLVRRTKGNWLLEDFGFEFVCTGDSADQHALFVWMFPLLELTFRC